MANEYYIDLDRLTLYDTNLKTYDTSDVKMNGTASVGTSKRCARADHIHPKDTSKANLASPTFTGTPKAPTAANGTNTTQIATTAFVQNAIGSISTGVTGVKGNEESSYRTGNVNLTPANIGAASDISSSASAGSLNIGISDDNNTQLSSTTITAANIVTAINNTPVNRAVSDENGNNISSTYALKSEISGVYIYKGSVATESNLPSSNQQIGDVYNIEADSTYGGAGTNVAWTGTAWDALGGIASISTATNAQINALFA